MIFHASFAGDNPKLTKEQRAEVTSKVFKKFNHEITNEKCPVCQSVLAPSNTQYFYNRLCFECASAMTAERKIEYQAPVLDQRNSFAHETRLLILTFLALAVMGGVFLAIVIFIRNWLSR